MALSAPLQGYISGNEWRGGEGDDRAAEEHAYRLEMERFLRHLLCDGQPANPAEIADPSFPVPSTPENHIQIPIPQHLVEMRRALGYPTPSPEEALPLIMLAARRACPLPPECAGLLLPAALLEDEQPAIFSFRDLAVGFSFSLTPLIWKYERHAAPRKHIVSSRNPGSDLGCIEGDNTYNAALKARLPEDRLRIMNDALRLYTGYLEKHTPDFSILCNLGFILFFEKGVASADALNSFRSAAAMAEATSPYHAAWAWLLVAYLHRCRREWPQAFQATAQANQLQPAWAETSFQHTISLASMQRYDEMRQAIAHTISQNPDYWFRALSDPDLLPHHELVTETLEELYHLLSSHVSDEMSSCQKQAERLHQITVDATAIELPIDATEKYLEDMRDTFAEVGLLRDQATFFEQRRARLLLKTVPNDCQKGLATLFQEGHAHLIAHGKQLNEFLQQLSQTYHQDVRDLEDRQLDELKSKRLLPDATQQTNSSAAKEGAPQPELGCQTFLYVGCGLGLGALLVAKGNHIFDGLGTYIGATLCIISSLFLFIKIIKLLSTPAPNAARPSSGAYIEDNGPDAERKRWEIKTKYEEEHRRLREEFEQKRTTILAQIDEEIENKRERLNELLRSSYARELSAGAEEAPPGQVLHNITAHDGAVVGVSFIPHGSLLASVGQDGMLRIWSGDHGFQQWERPAHAGGIFTLSVAPDGETLATAGADHTIRVWRISDGELLHTLNYTAHALQFSPDGEFLISGAPMGLITAWQTEDYAIRSTMDKHQGCINTLTFIPSVEVLMSAGDDGLIRQWKLPMGDSLDTPHGNGKPYAAIAISPDGSYMAAAQGADSVCVCQLNPFKELSIMQITSPALTATWAPSGDMLIAGGGDGEILVWHIPNLQTHITLSEHTAPITALACNHPGNRLASADKEGTIKIWSFWHPESP